MSAEHDELAFLVSAFRAHAECALESGAEGLAACDAELLSQRREQYRNYHGPTFDELLQVPATAEEGAPYSIDSRSGAATPMQTPEAQVADAEPVDSRGSAGDSAESPLEAQSGQGSTITTPQTAEAALKDEGPRPQAPDTREELPEAPSKPAEVQAPMAAMTDSTTPAAPGTWQQHLPERVHSEEALLRLRVLNSEVEDCTRCSLHETRNRAVFARGSGKSGICFVGEGPGADEDAQGYPFVGAAGQLLDKMIVAMGFDRDDVYVCNIVKCRPPGNRKPTPEEMNTCKPYIVEQLELLRPRVIVALGATAVQGLLGLSMGITRLRGQWRLYQGTTPVMPTFHPAYLLRKPSAKREVWQDLQQVLSQLEVPLPGKN